MPDKKNSDPEHDEVFSMLPWYVNRTLESSQRGSVSRHVGLCDECQREVQFLASLNQTVQSDSESQYRMHADVEKNLASVMSQIDLEPNQTRTAASWPSFLKQSLEKLFSFSIALPSAQWGATALAGLLVAVLGFQLYYGQSDDNYSVLSSPDIDHSSMRLSVEITSAAEGEQAQAVIQHEFEELGREIDIETKADGGYIVVFRDTVSVDELNDIIIDLENEVQINRVELLQ